MKLINPNLQPIAHMLVQLTLNIVGLLIKRFWLTWNKSVRGVFRILSVIYDGDVMNFFAKIVSS